MNARLFATILATATALVSSSVFADDQVRIAYIDPLSGPFATTGTTGLANLRFAAEVRVNAKGGVLGNRGFEVIGFDNKTSPQESIVQLQLAIDQGIRFIVQGASSAVAGVISDAVEKHNRRNPDKRVLFINISAIDPALTNEKCNFWHFRFDGNANIKINALTDVIAHNPEIKKVYIIGQDYSLGKSVASLTVAGLTEKRPDIEIVGNELHPIGKVTDFTPYARKITASGADAIVTANWGTDMVGLGKAVIDAGFTKPIYTLYAAAEGITRTFGKDGVNRIRVVTDGYLNPIKSPEAQAYVDAFKAKYPEYDISRMGPLNAIEMLAQAINKAGTAEDVDKVAYALEGMESSALFGGRMQMRQVDHQIIEDAYIVKHAVVPNDYDSSGYGLALEDTVAMAGLDSPTTCQMKRPQSGY
jgi:branched-chain amino acid transport system substrate-binding protein